mmetsp:Transcript_14245/g.19246  ORF Transcript_14245/g.19246 Transcript_14245/m.19246 type:complete len:109 (-) Transcript_14245:116-442(-)
MLRQGEAGSPDASLALYWLTQAADQGHIQAAEDLGVMHLAGEGTELDEEGSTYWFMIAEKLQEELEADRAGEEAYFDLGQATEEGDDSSKYEEAGEDGDKHLESADAR